LANATANGQGQSIGPSGVSGVSVEMPSWGTYLLQPQLNASSITITAGGSINLGGYGGGGFTLNVSAQGQLSTWAFTIINNSGKTESVTNLQLVTAVQERQFGGPIDNTYLGWVMEEADRVMKELAGGKDQLAIDPTTNQPVAYNRSLTLPAVYGGNLPPGFENMLERYVAAKQSGSFSNRFWFTPAEETLQRFVDPVTGQATVYFSQSAVQLNTEALLLGQPQDPTALAFANLFNANYPALEQLSFPVHDPSDATGTSVTYVKIFQLLEQAMQAVALDRFFHDNNIPLDTWWINSYTPAAAYTLASIPTLTNSLSNGAVTVEFYGGVTIKTPNTYVPNVVAQSIAKDVLAQRTPPTSGDVGAQAWSVTNTPVGNLNAVAASLNDEQQTGNITLGATDLSFASPGGEQLSFERYYNSSFLGSSQLGLGWQANAYQLQFQYPSMEDYDRLMRDSSGNPVPVYGAKSDTYLRSGEIRLMDQATGQFLNFFSSLSTQYALDGQGNPILASSGLAANAVPTFTAGQHTDGSTLIQNPITDDYIVTRPDGGTLVFDPQGNLLSTTDNKGYTITYTYNGGLLTQIGDSAGQMLTITYGSNGLIEYVAGPDNSATPQRRIAYVYDSSRRLIEVDTQALDNGSYNTVSSTKYQYNSSNQISAVVGPDGLTTLTDAPNLRGQSTQNEDVLGNTVANNYTPNAATGGTTTQSTDMGNANGVGDNPDASGNAALQYVAPGASSTTQLNNTAQVTQTTDALGDTTQYGYQAGSLLPNSVTLPTPNRPAISVQYNAANLPTVISDPANTGGKPVQIVYNAANLPVQTTDAKGLVTAYTYTSWNDVASVIVGYGTPLAATTQYVYNAQRLLQSVVDPLGHTVASYTYNALGQVLTVTDGDGITTDYAYDAIGRLIGVHEPQFKNPATDIQYSYNDDDQVTQTTTPTGNITYQYDPTTHRLTSETDLTGATTQYGYDPTTGLLTRITQVSAQGNAVTQEVYNRLGQLVLLIAPNGDRTAFQYDALGRATSMMEDTLVSPTATMTLEPMSATSLTVHVAANEPILVASLTYWQDGQQSSSEQTLAFRTNQTEYDFQMAGLDPSKPYRYQVTITDDVGKSLTLPSVLVIGPTAQFGIAPPAAVTAGTPFTFTVMAQDFSHNSTSTWTGTVHFTSSDPTGVLPPDATLVGGAGTFNATLKTASLQTITATVVGGTLTGSGTITIQAGAAISLGFSSYPSPTTAGVSNSVTVTLRDIYGNMVTGYTGTLHFTSTDAQAALPADYTFTATDAGVHTFSATLKTAGTQSLSVTDTANAALANMQKGIQLTPGAAASFVIRGYPVSTTAGLSNSFSVTAYDAYGNLATGYTGTVQFTSSDGQAGLPAKYTFTAADAGTHTFSAILKTAGTQSITATDTQTASLTGSQTGIAVAAAAATHLRVLTPASVHRRAAFAIYVVAYDAYGNVATGYRGTIYFYSSDRAASLPAEYTFTASDSGVHAFTVILRTLGTQAILATDTKSSSITDSAYVGVTH
jgi:YD repeat-containing protein